MNSNEITISDNAALRILKITSDGSNAGKKLRISVEGGGCSGLQYKYDFITEAEEEDIILQKNGADVIIDPTSAEYMKGSLIDYVQTLGFSSFEIKNPISSSKCGCGNSFSI